MSKINEEIFETSTETFAVMWWLLHLLGGKVVIPTEGAFWEDNFPADTWVALREENGKMVLVAEKAEEIS